MARQFPNPGSASQAKEAKPAPPVKPNDMMDMFEAPRWLKWLEATTLYAAALSIALWMLSCTFYVLALLFERLHLWIVQRKLHGFWGPTIGRDDRGAWRGWAIIAKGYSLTFLGWSRITMALGYFITYKPTIIMGAWFAGITRKIPMDNDVVAGIKKKYNLPDVPQPFFDGFDEGSVNFMRGIFFRDGFSLGDCARYVMASTMFLFGGFEHIWAGFHDIVRGVWLVFRSIRVTMWLFCCLCASVCCILGVVFGLIVLPVWDL